jgi:hypothetical protein
LGEQSAAVAGSIRDTFILVLLVHPNITGKALQFFRCHYVDGVPYLMEDYSLQCHDSWWFGQLFMILLVLFAFSFGTIFLIAFVLLHRRDELDSEDNKQFLGVLYCVYRPGAYYFGLIALFSSPFLLFVLPF